MHQRIKLLVVKSLLKRVGFATMSENQFNAKSCYFYHVLKDLIIVHVILIALCSFTFIAAPPTSSNSINLSSNRNEYRLPKATANDSQIPSSIQLNHQRQLPSLLSSRGDRSAKNLINYINREPPPPYQKRAVDTAPIQFETRNFRRPAPTPPTRSQIRSRVEEYRNRLSVSDESDSEQVQIRRRSRSNAHLRNANLTNGHNRRACEILLGNF